MKKVIILMVYFVMCISTAYAGYIKGTITKSNKPIDGAAIKVKVENKSYKAKTNKKGFYRLYIPRSGKYLMEVTIEGCMATQKIKVLKQTKTYNLVFTPKTDSVTCSLSIKGR